MRHAAFTIIEVMIAMLILAIAIGSVFSTISTIQQSNVTAAENRRAVEIAQIMVERLQGEAWHRLGRDPWSWHRREDAATLGTMLYCDELGSESPLEFKHRPLVDEPFYGVKEEQQTLYEYLREYNDKIGGGGADLSDFYQDEFGLPWTQDDQVDEFGDTADEALKPDAISLPGLMVAKYDTPLRYNWLQFVGVLDAPSGLNNLEVYLEYYRQDTLIGVDSRADWQTSRLDPANRYQQSHIQFDLAAEGSTLDRDAILAVVIVTWDRQFGGTGRYEVMVARRK